MYSSNNKTFDHWDKFIKYGYEIEQDCNIKILDGYTSGINSIFFKFLKGIKEHTLSIMIDENNIPSEECFKNFLKKSTKQL